MIKAVVFDLDGTLVDSEPLWKEAEIKILGALGVPLDFEMTQHTTGLSIDEVVKYWHSRFPWDEETHTFEKLNKEILHEVLSLIKSKSGLKEGVDYTIEFFQKKNIPMTIASSSPYNYINEIVHFFKLDEFFPRLFSAVEEDYVKPHPAVYLKACKHFEVAPQNALAFEDSFYGLLSAKAAQMKAVAVLEPNDYLKTRFDFADIKIPDLNSFNEAVFEQLNAII
jgi:beta-phosphoglucomutase-like phosphatase (HAD superfamily)